MKQFYVILTPFFPSEKEFVGPFIYDQVKAIQALSMYEVLVIKLSNSSIQETYEYQGVFVHQIKLIDLPSFIFPGLFNKVNKYKIQSKLRELTGDRLDSIRFIHGHVTYPFGILASQLAKKIGADSIVQHHGFDVMGYTNGRFQNKWLRSLNKYWINKFHVPFLNQASWNVGVSRKTLNELNYITGYKSTREYVLYNGIDSKKFYPIQGAKDTKKFKIGCVANFWPIKDQLTLIKAVQILVSVPLYCDIYLQFIGSGPTLNICKDFVEDNHLQANIEFLDTQDHKKMNLFYNSLNLFVLPSNYEALGCVYMEAFACGVPFIAIEGQGIEELILPENRQYQLVEPLQYSKLSERILFFYKNRDFKPALNQDIHINKLVGRFLNTINSR